MKDETRIPNPERRNFFMQRCLDLAMNGFPRVMPNPMVGCVIVNENNIIGEGYHREFGKAHAEDNAINSVSDKSLFPASTLYVNLEPCAHTGKTPPCADLIIKNGFKKIVIAAVDPNPAVSGKGIEKLKAAGIEVVCGVLENEAKELNKRFNTFHQKKRPYVILKWAQTKDGFIADQNGDSKWISNEYSRLLVHKWRTEEMAILAGFKTIEKDNSMLTARDWPGKNPARIIIDKNLKLPVDLNIFHANADVFIFNSVKDHVSGHLHYMKINFNENILTRVFSYLYTNNIQSVIVEGGRKLLLSFIKENLWDEARIFISEKTFGQGLSAPEISGRILSEKNISGDTLKVILQDK